MFSYFEDSIEPENRSLKQKVVVPSKTTFKGRRWDGWDRNKRHRKMNKAERVIMTHTDADGYVSGALFKEYFEGECKVVTVDYEDIESTLNYILNKEDGEDEEEDYNKVNELYVCDLNLDEIPDSISPLMDKLDVFKWFDHHEWGEKEEELQNLGVDVTIDKDECGASIVHNYITENGYSSNSKIENTVELTKDHDLWKHNMNKIHIGGQDICISNLFSQMAFYSNAKTFIDEILSIGKNFMDSETRLLNGNKDPEDKNYREAGYLARKIKESSRKVDYVVDHKTSIEEIEGYNVAFAYGRASPGEILEQLTEVDILVHTKPSYPVKISFRSTDSFKECHKIAEEFGGGGHEQASGCKPEMFQEPLDWFDYIAKEGEPLEQEARKVVREYLKKN